MRVNKSYVDREAVPNIIVWYQRNSLAMPRCCKYYIILRKRSPYMSEICAAQLEHSILFILESFVLNLAIINILSTARTLTYHNCAIWSRLCLRHTCLPLRKTQQIPNLTCYLGDTDALTIVTTIIMTGTKTPLLILLLLSLILPVSRGTKIPRGLNLYVWFL